MYKIGGFSMREALNDLPTRCTCCVNRRQLIAIPDDNGITFKCPATLCCFRVTKGDARVLPALYTGV